MSAPRALLVAVSYGPPHDALDLLASLARLEELDTLDAVVVDSSSTPGTRAALERGAATFPGRLQLQFEQDNVYYWGGAERALNRWRAEHGGLPEWVIICNADVLIDQRDFLPRLYRSGGQGVAAVAHAVLSAVHGGDQNPLLAQRPSAAYYLRWRLYYTHYAVARVLRALWQASGRAERTRHGDSVPTSGAPIYAPHGAFVCLQRAFFDCGGWLDTNFRLYAEENTLAETVRRLGLQVIYRPDLRVIHRENGATGKALTRWEYEVTREAWSYFRRAYLDTGRTAAAGTGTR
jgi:GT2 family glycosyltransferase